MTAIPLNVVERLSAALGELRRLSVDLETSLHGEIAQVHPEHHESARNLVHYVALRQQDIRGLQGDLAGLGLSSLGRLEGHVLATLDAVLTAIHGLAGRGYEWAGGPPCVNPPTAAALLAEHSRLLLGPRPMRRSVRVMVTMPSEAAKDSGLVRDLLAAGMNVMRVNCAHDGPEEWKAMIGHLRQVERDLGLTCQIQADLPGPKLRTGSIAPLARAVKLRPERDSLGQVLRPARAWLTPADDPEPLPADVATSIGVRGDALPMSDVGDQIGVHDARGRRRALKVVAAPGRSRIVESTRTVYFVEGTPLRLRRASGSMVEGRAEGLPEVVEPILLRNGDMLALTRADQPGRPSQRNAEGGSTAPAQIHCTSEEAFDTVKVDDRVFLDDGKIGGVVSANDGQQILVRVTQTAGKESVKLRAEKGVNFPDTELNVACPTPRDVAALEAIGREVDMVGLSFVQRPEDLDTLREHLRRLDVPGLGIVLKVENRAAFENLPRLLLAALRSRPVGVMVARGDLGVELGFERLSEVQEEILWLCEAAHVPVVWATQVLDGMARTGSPTRAEVTDAAMSARAECVMLNKGPHIVAAVEFLCGVLERMDSHHSKKTAMLRKLAVSENLRPNAHETPFEPSPRLNTI